MSVGEPGKQFRQLPKEVTRSSKTCAMVVDYTDVSLGFKRFFVLSVFNFGGDKVRKLVNITLLRKLLLSEYCVVRNRAALRTALYAQRQSRHGRIRARFLKGGLGSLDGCRV